MASITYRSVKGSPLLNSEVDGNFQALNTEKIERDGSIPFTKRAIFAAATGIPGGASFRVPDSGATPTTLDNGDFWNELGVLQFFNGAVTARVLTEAVSDVALLDNLTVPGNFTAGGVGKTGTFNFDVVLFKDANITLGKVATPTDVTADGGGITVKGTTDKTFSWAETFAAWESSETIGLAAGKTFQINHVDVLTATALGTTVVASSLTSLGTIAALVATNEEVTNSLGVGMSSSGISGRIDAANDVVAFSTSDRRFKTNITNIPNALDKVCQLNGVLFDWNPERYNNHGYEGRDTGLIAQEVQAVLPEIVKIREDGYLGIRYEKLAGLLVEAIKALNNKIDQ